MNIWIKSLKQKGDYFKTARLQAFKITFKQSL